MDSVQAGQEVDHVTFVFEVSLSKALIPDRYPSTNGNSYSTQIPIHCAWGKNIHVGKNFYSGFNLTIGDGCVIGAGSVVTRDIPAESFACGTPCRVVRKITDDDRITDEIALYQ